MRSEGVTHSESGYNIRPMSTAQVEGAARRLSPLAHSVSLEAATEPPFQGVTVDGTRWDGGERGGVRTSVDGEERETAKAGAEGRV